MSIQGLILVPEPYFNEPGFEGSLGTKQVRTCFVSCLQVACAPVCQQIVCAPVSK